MCAQKPITGIGTATGAPYSVLAWGDGVNDDTIDAPVATTSRAPQLHVKHSVHRFRHTISGGHTRSMAALRPAHQPVPKSHAEISPSGAGRREANSMRRVRSSTRITQSPTRSCPVAWCSCGRAPRFTGRGRIGQLAIAERPTAGSSLSGAMVSSAAR